MLQPQSDEELRPYIEALRRLDPLLDIRWNPRAIRTVDYDALGQCRAPAYEGRWQVIRHNTPSLHEGRAYTVICTVTQQEVGTKARLMIADGPYAPVGDWLVEYLQRWDAAQARFQVELDALWQEHERVDQLEHDEAAHQDALEKVYREHGSEYWMGRGFGKGRRSSDAPTTPHTIQPAGGTVCP